MSRWSLSREEIDSSNTCQQSQRNGDTRHSSWLAMMVSHTILGYIYTGRVVQIPELPAVGQTIPTQQNYKLFFDNWFTGVPLILSLAQHGIPCTRTVRCKRLPGVNLMCEAELKRTECGSFEQKMAIVGEIPLRAVKGCDTRSISLLSNYIGAYPVTEVDTWNGKRKEIINIPCTAVVREYNKNMGW